MEGMPTGLLFFILFLCLCCSAFFSSSETAMMSLNRYRLKHRVEEGDAAAKRAEKLLKSPDRLLGTILLGNNFVNILATSLGTILGLRLFGDYGVLVATISLTIVVLIFAEIAPKTFAAIMPERIAMPASRVLLFLVAVLYPLVWVLNRLIALLFKPFGIDSQSSNKDLLTNEELKTIVMTAVPPSASGDQDMLINVLELEDATVDEVMVPRQEIVGIDLNDSWEDISAQIHQTRHSRLVVYRDHLDQVEGILHLCDIISLYRDERFNVQAITEIMRPCVFIPEHTLLRQQLLLFRQQKQRAGLVVDEYGDIQGMVTLEDILTHIVGDISETEEEALPEIVALSEQRYDVQGGISLRVLNRELGLRLPLDGPNTLSGLIIETLGNFPKVGTEVALEGCIVRVKAFANGIVEQSETELLPPEDEDN